MAIDLIDSIGNQSLRYDSRRRKMAEIHRVTSKSKKLFF